MVDIRNKIQVLDVVSGKGAAGVIPTTINTVKQEPSRFQPYRNTYQKHQQQPVLRDNNKLAYSQSNLNILSFPSQGEVKRPTLESIASHAAAQGREVTTPQQLLDMCCQFPACYDPLYQVAWLCYALLQCSFTFDFQSVSQFAVPFQFTLVIPSFLMITLIVIATFSALHRYMPQMRASLPCHFLASMSTPAQHPRLYIPQSVMDGRCFL